MLSVCLRRSMQIDLWNKLPLLWHRPAKNRGFVTFPAEIKTFHCLITGEHTSLRLFPWEWNKEHKNYFSIWIPIVCTLSQLLYLIKLSKNLFKWKEKQFIKSERASQNITCIKGFWEVQQFLGFEQIYPFWCAGGTLACRKAYLYSICLKAYVIHAVV